MSGQFVGGAQVVKKQKSRPKQQPLVKHSIVQKFSETRTILMDPEKLKKTEVKNQNQAR